MFFEIWGTHGNSKLSDHARTLALELLDQYEDHGSTLSLFKQVLHLRHTEGLGASPCFSGLLCVSFFGIVEFALALINAKGCEINKLDSPGNTPLFWATDNGHDEVAKLLLEQEDADPNHPGVDSRTPIGCAALKGHEYASRSRRYQS